MKVKIPSALCVLIAILVAAGCAPAKAPKAETPSEYRSLRMVGATIGSKSTTAVMAFAAILNKYYPEISWSSSSGSTSTNPIYLTKGTSKLAMVPAASWIDAYGFDKILESRVKSINFPAPLTYFLFLIPEDKPWKDISEVPKGSSIGIDTAGTIPLTYDTWLALAGLSKKDFNSLLLSKAELQDAWRASKIDLVFVSTAGAEPYIVDMYIGPRKWKPMGLSAEQVDKAKAQRTFERLGFEAPGKGILSELAPQMFKYDVLCAMSRNLLSARDDFPEEVAYKMANVIDEHNAELVQIFSPMKFATPKWHIQWSKPPLEIHPGVARYYREKGYLK